jgi:hypothetical protein
MSKLGLCQVGSQTEDSCLRPAVVKIRGVPFCEKCAQEQEAYFAIGELTEFGQGFRDESLVELVHRGCDRRRGSTWPLSMNPMLPKAVVQTLQQGTRVS